MLFDHPALAIGGLAAVVIPIAIFLLWRQRRTPVPWAAMRFLLEAYRKHRRRLQIEQLLLLLVRCLAVALIGFALARPLLKDAGLLTGGASRVVFLVLDNGLVSQVDDASGKSALQRHVATAKTIVEELGPGDRIGVLTAARPAHWDLLPPSTDHGAVLQLLDEIESSHAPTDLLGTIDRLRDALVDPELIHENALVYLLSDFRAGSAALDQALAGSLKQFGDRVTFRASVPAADAAPNVQIASIEPARSMILPDAADGSDQLTIRLERSGGELGSQITRVRLSGDALASVEPKIVNWAPGESSQRVDFLLRFESQHEQETGITVQIDRDALAADDERHAVLSLRRTIRAVLLDRRSFGADRALDRLTAGQWITRALEPIEDAPIELIEVEPATLDRLDLRAVDVAVLPRPDLLNDSGWTELSNFVGAGGLLVILPPGELHVHQWTDHVGRDLGLPWSIERETIEYDEPMLLAAEQPSSRMLGMILGDLPVLARPVVINRALPLTTSDAPGEPLLVMQDGLPLAIAGTPESHVTNDADSNAESHRPEPRGMVVYLAVSPQLDWTNLPAKPLMVPFFQEVIRQGLSLIRTNRSIGAGDRPMLALGPAVSAVVPPNGAGIVLDRTKRPVFPLKEIGLYDAQDAAGQSLGVLAVNVNPAAGRTDPQAQAAVGDWLKQSGEWSWLEPQRIGAQLKSSSGVSPLTGAAITAIVLLLLAETLLARRASHAQTSGSSARRSALAPTMHDRMKVEGAA